MSPSNIDVLVVGAGPTGLVTALTLAKNGIPVRIVEKLSQYSLGQRGAGIMPRTLEVYHFLGVLEDVKNMGVSKSIMKEWKDGKPFKTYAMTTPLEPTPMFPERRSYHLGQDAACGILRKHLKVYGVEVELETELVRLEQDENSVTATVVKRQDGKQIEDTITAKYVVGADGAKGAVRKLLDLTFLGETLDAVHIIIGDAKVYGLDQDHWHKFGDGPSDGAILRPTHRYAEDIYFFAIFGPNLDYDRAVKDHEYFRQFIYNVAKVPDLKIGEVETISNYRPNIRVVNSFRKGRVFIAGDAAHVHSATGGQGMNSSVMDAFNLSWKLALAIKGLASPSLLDSYDTERLPVIKEMLQRTTAILNRTFTTENGKSTPVASTDNDAESPWKRSTQLNQLGVHYRWSPIVVDEAVDELGLQDKDKAEALTASTYVVEEGGRLHAGDRAPDSPGLVDLKTGRTMRLFDIFGPDHHTLLVFTDGDPASVLAPLARIPKNLIRTVAIRSQGVALAEVAGVDLSLQDKEGYAYPAYGAHVAVVRPDGVVGALVDGAEGVEKYFAGIFAL
ncbi:monooxygenase [Dentipellis sp. KUC8613]|nr:monooxygenase [Dentipellis sp. KUC8613]